MQQVAQSDQPSPGLLTESMTNSTQQRPKFTDLKQITSGLQA